MAIFSSYIENLLIIKLKKLGYICLNRGDDLPSLGFKCPGTFPATNLSVFSYQYLRWYLGQNPQRLSVCPVFVRLQLKCDGTR